MNWCVCGGGLAKNSLLGKILLVPLNLTDSLVIRRFLGAAVGREGCKGAGP